MSTEGPDAKPVGRDVALKHINGSKANYVFEEKTFRNFRQTFDVLEHTLGQFPVHGAT